MLEQAIRLVSGISQPLFGPLEFLYGWFEDAGCRAYVKTIYVGFDLNGYLVAAIYVRGGEYLEVALALPADDRFPDLYPADHLKWASLPVAFQVRPEDDLSRLVPVLERTLDRARHGFQAMAGESWSEGRPPFRRTPPSTRFRRKEL